MATTLTTKFQPGISLVGVKTAPAWQKASSSPNLADDVSLANGTGVGQADLHYTARIALATSASSNIDLTGAGIVDIFGNVLAFVKVKGFFIHNRSDDTSPATAAAVNVLGNFITAIFGVSTSYPLAAGDSWQHSAAGAGNVVTAGTGDVITLTNQSGSETAEVDVIIIGTSA